MTYYGSKDLAASFRQVRGNTIQIAEDTPESKFDVRAAPECRTFAQTLVHIAVLPRFQMHVHQKGLTDFATVDFGALIGPLAAEEGKPRTKAEIIALLKSEGEAYASYMASLDEAFLAQQVTMPPGAEPAVKTRFEMLLSTKEHEMHHRAQLMVLQRMMGITPHLTRQMQERMARRADMAQASS